MRIALVAALAGTAAMTAGCTTYGNGDGPYYADRYYRSGAQYQPYALSSSDRIWRGQDGRYYCRRPDGTTGLVVGAAVGGTLGAIIAPGGSELLGALIGGAAGALLGREVERGEVRCQ